MKRLLFIGVALFLSSCVSRQDQLNVYRKNCLDYGFRWGTPEFAQCVKDQEYQSQKLGVERRKAQAFEIWGYKQPQYDDSWASHHYQKPRKRKAYGKPYYPSHQKVKQKVQSTTHIHQTHIQQTYNQPQPIIIQQEVPQAPQRQPMDMPQELNPVVEQSPSFGPTEPLNSPVEPTMAPPVMAVPESQAPAMPIEQAPIYEAPQPPVSMIIEDHPLEIEAPAPSAPSPEFKEIQQSPKASEQSPSPERKIVEEVGETLTQKNLESNVQ